MRPLWSSSSGFDVTADEGCSRCWISRRRNCSTTPKKASPSCSTSTRASRSSEVGRIDSKEAHAVITVVIVEDTAQPPDRMRGIRVDLSKGDRRDVVYLGEETLPAYRDALDEISREAARERSANNVRENLTQDGTAYVGACI